MTEKKPSKEIPLDVAARLIQNYHWPTPQKSASAAFNAESLIEFLTNECVGKNNKFVRFYFGLHSPDTVSAKNPDYNGRITLIAVPLNDSGSEDFQNSSYPGLPAPKSMSALTLRYPFDEAQLCPPGNCNEAGKDTLYNYSIPGL